MPQVLRTHVFIDMKGYGRLLAERPNAETMRVMRTFLRTVRSALPRPEVEADQNADVFHLVFTDASEAVRVAMKIVDALEKKQAAGRVLAAGVGLDVGQSLRSRGRYVGVALANAAALSHRARPGQILITQNVLALVRNELAQPPRDLGPLPFAQDRVRVFELRSSAQAEADDARPDASVLALLFFDMVDSTARALAAGSTKWKSTVEKHHAIAREVLRRYRGVEVDTAGDGFYVTFDLPSRAIDCAIAIRDEVRRELNIDLRAGVHCGECEIVNGKTGGVNVAAAARIMSHGGAGEVLVSQAVKDMLLGARYVFETFGQVELKGVPGQWTLYRASHS